MVVDKPRWFEDEGGGGKGAFPSWVAGSPWYARELAKGAKATAEGAPPKRCYECQLKKEDTVKRTCSVRTA